MDAETMTVAAPGSPTAIASGCRCDPRLNRNGDGAGTNGRGEPLFIPARRCPIHGDRKGAA